MTTFEDWNDRRADAVVRSLVRRGQNRLKQMCFAFILVDRFHNGDRINDDHTDPQDPQAFLMEGISVASRKINAHPRAWGRRAVAVTHF